MYTYIITAIFVLVGTILTILGGFIGYFIKDFLDKKREMNSENIKVKREMYKEFIILLLKVINNNARDTQGNVVPIDIKKEMHKFYEDYLLYSSPFVINAYGDFMQYVYKNPQSMDTKILLGKLANVVKSMRKELGLSNKNLGNNGKKIFRAMFKDFDNFE